MISIIIVGYNSRKDLPDCFESIYKSTYKDFRIIFVDNNSSDASIEYVKNNYPDTVTIKNTQNLGFAAANNLAINKSIELKTDYIFMLNPDTVIDKDCLKTLVENASTSAILQPLILMKQNQSLINTAGSYLNFLGISYCNNYLDTKETITENTQIPACSGAAMFLPIDVAIKTGDLDESFFMYDEDLDYSWRARLLGFSILLIPEAVVCHQYDYSRNKLKYYHIEKNRLTFILKNFSLITILFTLPIHIINELLMILYSILNQWFKVKIKSYQYLFSNYKKIIDKRKTIQKNRIVADANLKKYIGSKIDYQEINSPLFKPYNLFLNIYWSLIKPLIK